jgi:hypothetical protein
MPEKFMKRLPSYYNEDIADMLFREDDKYDRFKRTRAGVLEAGLKEVKRVQRIEYTKIINHLESVNDVLVNMLK